MAWTVELCDLTQTDPSGPGATPLSLTGRRAGAKVTIGRKEARLAEVHLSLDDPAAELATSTNTVLRIKDSNWSTPVFLGRVLRPETKRSADGEGITLYAMDPLAHLERLHYLNKVTYSSSPPTLFQVDPFSIQVPPFTVVHGLVLTATDESQALWTLINSVTGHGIAQGTLASALARTLAFPPGKQIAEAIREITDSEGGVEFEFSPFEATDGTLVKLNTYYPRQGSDKSATVIFKHAFSDESAKEFTLAPERPVNEALVIGGASAYAMSFQSDLDPAATLSLAYRAWHQGSIDTYGRWQEIATYPEITNAAYLQSKAIGMVAAARDPVPFFDFAPSLPSQDSGTGKVFGPNKDFWMGDTIACQASLPYHDPGEMVSVSGRVNQATLTEQENGDVAIDLTCAPEVGSGSVSSELLYFVGTDGNS